MMDTIIEHKGYRGVVAASGRIWTLMSNAAVDAVELQEGVIGIQAGSSELRRRHGELIKDGMEKARQEGRRIGRPRVTEEEGFESRFIRVAGLIDTAGLSIRAGAQELGISMTSLRRLLPPYSD